MDKAHKGLEIHHIPLLQVSGHIQLGNLLTMPRFRAQYPHIPNTYRCEFSSNRLSLKLIVVQFVLDQTLEEPAVWVFSCWCSCVALRFPGVTSPSVSLLGLIPLMQLHEITTHQLTTRLGGSTSGLINASMVRVKLFKHLIINEHNPRLTCMHHCSL